MRRTLLLPTALLVFLGLGEAGIAQQGEGEAGMGMAPEKEWVRVTDDAEAGELTFTIGPVDLSVPGSHHLVKQPPLVTVEVPIEGYLYGYTLRVDDGRGNEIPQAVVHHINLIDLDHRELFSPVAQRLFAAGSETQSASMPKVLGIPLEKGQRLMISSMFHNPTGEPHPETYLHVTINYRKKGWFFPIEVHPVYIDVMGHVGPKDFDLPPGEYQRSWEGSPAIAGRLLAAGGHLHEYATKLRFEDVTKGKILWEIGPVLDDEGKLETVPIGKFWWKGGIKLTPEHTYRLTAFYDNPTGATIPGGGMGVLGGVLKPARGAEWPAVDPNDPEFLANMEETRKKAELRAAGLGGHGHAPAEPEHDHADHDHGEHSGE